MEEDFEEEIYYSEESEQEIYEDDDSLSPEEEGFMKGYNEALDSEEM